MEKKKKHRYAFRKCFATSVEFRRCIGAVMRGKYGLTTRCENTRATACSWRMATSAESAVRLSAPPTFTEWNGLKIFPCNPVRTFTGYNNGTLVVLEHCYKWVWVNENDAKCTQHSAWLRLKATHSRKHQLRHLWKLRNIHHNLVLQKLNKRTYTKSMHGAACTVN